MVGVLQPLGSQFPIVNPDGTPTTYFIRWAQQRQIDITDSIPATREIATGKGLTGGGDLSEDRTISLDADLADLNDVDFSTPPTSGEVLEYNGAKWVPAAGGGGGGGSLTLLQNIVLTSDTTAITFPLIDQGYKDLIVATVATSVNRGSGADTTMLGTLNGDTGANYNHALWSRFEGTQTFNETSGWFGSNIPYSDPIDWWPTEFTLFNYTNTTQNKHWFCRTSLFGGGNFATRMIDGFWASHAAVTQIDLFLGGQTFKAGSTFALYGRG